MISVIIPTYNRAYCLESSIRSVLDQSYTDIEVIVVDDCSTDDTEKLVLSFDDERLKYFKLPENGGPCKARNFGIKHAAGDLIAFHDSDDIWHKDKLEKQLNVLNKNLDCSLVFCKYKTLDERPLTIPIDDSFPADKEEMFNILVNENKIGTPTMLLKKSILEVVGVFDESLYSLEDWELALRIARASKICFCNEVLVDVYPSKSGVNKIIGMKRLYTYIKIFDLYYDNSRDKDVFKNLLNSVLDEIYGMNDRDRCTCFDILKNSSVIFGLLYNRICELKADIAGEKKIADERQAQLEKMNDCYWEMNKITGERQDQLEKMTERFSFEKLKINVIFNFISSFFSGNLLEKFGACFSLYGAGNLSQCLIPLCQKYGIRIPFTIDRKPKNIFDIPCYTIDEIPDRSIPIIITVFDPDRKIIADLKGHTDAEIMYLDDIL